ncbi:LysM repeat-containing protein, partial [Carnobacterium iners]
DSGQTDSNTTVTSSYQVKNGDSLWGIAASNKVSVANLKSWNKLKSDVIYIGQKLIFQSVTQNVPIKENATKIYRVLPGDTLWAISKKINIPVTKLKEWNYLKTDIIFVGQSILIK